MLMPTIVSIDILETNKPTEVTMARKTKRQAKSSGTGKLVLILFALIIIIGTIVLAFIYFTEDAKTN